MFRNFKYILLKVILLAVGISFTIIALFSVISLFKILNKENFNIIESMFTDTSICEDFESPIEINNFCIDLNSAYWLVSSLIISLIISFLCLFPLFLIQKKKKNGKDT